MKKLNELLKRFANQEIIIICDNLQEEKQLFALLSSQGYKWKNGDELFDYSVYQMNGVREGVGYHYLMLDSSNAGVRYILAKDIGVDSSVNRLQRVFFEDIADIITIDDVKKTIAQINNTVETETTKAKIFFEAEKEIDASINTFLKVIELAFKNGEREVVCNNYFHLSMFDYNDESMSSCDLGNYAFDMIQEKVTELNNLLEDVAITLEYPRYIVINIKAERVNLKRMSVLYKTMKS